MDLTVRKDAVITRVPPRSTGCEREGPHLVQALHGYRVATHAGCTCNELQALTKRHLIPRGLQLDVNYFKSQCFDVHVDVGRPLSKLEFINNYSGAKKRSYSNAYHTLQQSVSFDALSRIKMFVKPDKLTIDKAETGAPRAIQYRTPEFNLLVGRWLKPYEEALYEQLKAPTGFKAIAKGMNNYQRAANIAEAAKLFQCPVFLLLDHAKFDSCVHKLLLKWTHRQYNRAFRNAFLRFLLSKTLINRCKSANGVKYKVEGTRMSGDYDTALGNCLVNFLLLTSWLKGVYHHVLLDGDDSVVIVELKDLERVLANFGHFAKMGFDTEMQVVYNINEVEFCRAKFLDIEPPRFARDPVRVMSNWNVANSFVAPEMLSRYLAGVGIGELACNAGVPILGPCARKLADLHTKPILQDSYRYAYGVDIGTELVSDDARLAFEDTFGISAREQLLIESEFAPSGVGDCARLLSHYESLPCQV